MIVTAHATPFNLDAPLTVTMSVTDTSIEYLPVPSPVGGFNRDFIVNSKLLNSGDNAILSCELFFTFVVYS